MRQLGISILGLFSGLLVGFLITEAIARPMLADGGQIPDSVPLGLLLGFGPPILAIVGILVALRIDRKLQRDKRSNSKG
ncbi:DUF5957 family protein [Amycolatopsis nigrescens]|uniref:DUF5957 family protein n=1 Tax=Amycolatopsis nigrescens TaxID=381445 RepID=UPI0003824B1D|nr:DUF5957 family protein [Amycolatopsis nigrescens]